MVDIDIWRSKDYFQIFLFTFTQAHMFKDSTARLHRRWLRLLGVGGGGRGGGERGCYYYSSPFNFSAWSPLASGVFNPFSAAPASCSAAADFPVFPFGASAHTPVSGYSHPALAIDATTPLPPSQPAHCMHRATHSKFTTIPTMIQIQ